MSATRELTSEEEKILGRIAMDGTATVNKGDHIRYTVTCINRDGMRTIIGPNQGRCHKKTRKQAEGYLKSLLESNHEDKFRQIWGPQSIGTFRVDPILCYHHGDAKGIYISDPEAPFDKEYAEYLK